MSAISRYKRNPWVFHTLFWVGYLVIGISIMIGAYTFQSALFRVSMGMIFNAILIYMNLYWVFPTYFMKGKYIIHYLIMAALVLSTAYLRVIVDLNYAPEESFLAVEHGSFSHFASKVMIGVIVLSFSTSFKYFEDYLERRDLEQELKQYKLEAELKLLKTQVNPHFLFNTLNNIYSIAHTNGKEAAPMILRLSDMMRYMLYESNEPTVPLDKEIQYLHNYIELQQLKTEYPQHIQLSTSGETAGARIAPMLFIPFLENSFKHGNVSDSDDGFVTGKLSVEKGELVFYLENSVGQVRSKDKTGGIGLENVKRRLAMIYPKKHKLKISQQKDVFIVDLSIQLS